MKVGVIGAGTMGQGIAKAFAQVDGYEVALCDIKQEWADGGKEKIKKIVKWLWLLCFVLMYLINITAGIVFLAIWFVGKFIVNKMMDNQIQAHLQESKVARQASAARLGV